MAGRSDRTPWLVAVAPGLALALFTLALGGGWAATLDDAGRSALLAQLEERVALVVLMVGAGGVALGTLARRLHDTWVRQPQRLAELAGPLLSGAVAEVPVAGAATRELAEVMNALARQRLELQAAIDEKVREASRSVEQERARLAALMAELQQSVVVCNLDGRILLFNRRARLQFRALAPAAGPGHVAVAGGELVGIGRSIHAVLDRQLVSHALEGLVQRLQRGVAHPSAQFVTHTRGGQLLRVHLAAVRDVAPSPGATAAGLALAGYVLMIENITREFSEDAARDQLLARFTETTRASVGNLQAAVELLDESGLDDATRTRLQGVVREETQATAARIAELAAHAVSSARTRWPLEDVQGADLLAAARRRLQALADAAGRPDSVGTSALSEAEPDPEPDPSVWLRVDSYSLLRTLEHLGQRLLRHDPPPSRLALTLRPHRPAAGGTARVELDLAWQGAEIGSDEIARWEHEPLDGGSATVSLREVVERHDGAFWRVTGAAAVSSATRGTPGGALRFLLPRAASDGAEAMAAELLDGEARPEFYDFDLFGTATPQHADAPLAALSFTVFDTETTGLNPSDGDEILQIGAARIVAGKLRREACFEQLVNPGRSIPEAGIAIHGIRPEMVSDAPPIGPVLQAFAAFAEDSVLVAHNAAFDMRFLQLKEQATGIRFTQPVLDTLLLAELAQPQQSSHSLEAIAQRLGVSVLGRHTALGDALVTAEVFLKLLPLLQQRGIVTLAQALEASRKTWAARLAY